MGTGRIDEFKIYAYELTEAQGRGAIVLPEGGFKGRPPDEARVIRKFYRQWVSLDTGRQMNFWAICPTLQAMGQHLLIIPYW